MRLVEHACLYFNSLFLMEKSPFRGKKTGGLFFIIKRFLLSEIHSLILHGYFIMSIPRCRNKNK